MAATPELSPQDITAQLDRIANAKAKDLLIS
jgi:hypothetical protein